MDTKLFACKIVGISPLLHHKYNGTKSSGGRAKTEYDPQEEAEAALYKNADDGVCQPANHIEGALIKAAVAFKFKGKKTFKDVFKAGIFIEPALIPLENPWIIDTQGAIVNRSRIMRSRPMFEEWSVTFRIRVIDTNITKDLLQDVLEEAGTYVGIGDYRPRFGRFSVEMLEDITNGNREEDGRSAEKKSA